MSSLPKFIQQTSVYKDELTLYVAPSAIEPVMLFLRDHANTQYKSVMDICGADYPARSNRFEIVYHLLSVRHNSRIRVKTYADETSPVPSIAHIYRGADWCVPSLSPGSSGTPDFSCRQVRARGVGHVRHPVQQPPRPAPHLDRLRLRGPPAPKGLPPHRASLASCGVFDSRNP